MNLRSRTWTISWTKMKTDLSGRRTILNRATYKDAKNANKIALKGKHEKVELKFTRLGNIAYITVCINWKQIKI